MAASMACPMCGAATRSGHGGGSYAVKERANKRTRHCVGTPSHSFTTLERPNLEDVLEATQVGDADHEYPFDRGRLLRDLNYTLGDVLSIRARREIADRAQGILGGHLPPTTGRDRRLPAGVAARLAPSVVQDAVAEALRHRAQDYGVDDQYRRSYRRAHVMWVLARGTSDGRFERVPDVLSWLKATYGREADRPGRGFRVERHYTSVVTDIWHPLRADAAPEPKWIVFLLLKEQPPSPDGSPRVRYEHERKPFERERLLTSVRHALAGRDDHSRVASMVVQWTLWSVGGQTVVRSADLASQVTQCLRRVDEIAYLRWCIKVKDLDVNDIWDESLGMLSWPSPRLAFEPEAAQDPRRLEGAMPTASQETLGLLPAAGDEAPQ